MVTSTLGLIAATFELVEELPPSIHSHSRVCVCVRV